MRELVPNGQIPGSRNLGPAFLSRKLELFGLIVANLDGSGESLGRGSLGVREEEPVPVLEGLELLGDDPGEGGAEHAPCK